MIIFMNIPTCRSSNGRTIDLLCTRLEIERDSVLLVDLLPQGLPLREESKG